MAIISRLFEAIEELGLSIMIFARDCASLPWCFEEHVKIVGFMDEMRSNTVFPVSCDVEQSKIDDQTESYTIVFDKIGKNLRENKEKVQRWMDILSEVEISSRLKRYVNKSFFFFFFWHGKNTVQGSVHNGVTSVFFSR